MVDSKGFGFSWSGNALLPVDLRLCNASSDRSREMVPRRINAYSSLASVLRLGHSDDAKTHPHAVEYVQAFGRAEERMARYEPFSRTKLRGLRRGWVRRNWVLVTALGAGALGLLVFETLIFALVEPSPLRWWMLGVLQAAVVAAFLHLMHIGPLIHDREALWQLRGAWGEENTRDLLRRARRRRLIWGWVDSIQLQSGDLDHYVVSRRGGLIVIDSKWRSTTVDLAEMAQAAARVKTRAEGIARSRFAVDRTARHRDRINPLAVTPVIVVWGGAQDELRRGERVDGIEFVRGQHLMSWFTRLDGNHVDQKAATEVIRELKAFRSSSGVSVKSR